MLALAALVVQRGSNMRVEADQPGGGGGKAERSPPSAVTAQLDGRARASDFDAPSRRAPIGGRSPRRGGASSSGVREASGDQAADARARRRLRHSSGKSDGRARCHDERRAVVAARRPPRSTHELVRELPCGGDGRFTEHAREPRVSKSRARCCWAALRSPTSRRAAHGDAGSRRTRRLPSSTRGDDRREHIVSVRRLAVDDRIAHGELAPPLDAPAAHRGANLSQASGHPEATSCAHVDGDEPHLGRVDARGRVMLLRQAARKTRCVHSSARARRTSQSPLVGGPEEEQHDERVR